MQSATENRELSKPNYELEEFGEKSLEKLGIQNAKVLVNYQSIRNLIKEWRRTLTKGAMGQYLYGIYSICNDYAHCDPDQLLSKLSSCGDLQKWFNDCSSAYTVDGVVVKTVRKNGQVKWKKNVINGGTFRLRHHGLLRFLEANGVNTEGIVEDFRVDERPPKPFTNDEVRNILRAVRGNARLTLMVWLLCTSFQRFGVIYGLTFLDFMDLLESNKTVGLVWIDGIRFETKERKSYDMPVSPEVINALKQRRLEIEKQSKQRIDRSNADEFPICSTKYDPRARLDSISLRHELREVLQKANAVGQSSGEGSGKRYVKDIHTGFRGYCFSQWRGDPLLAKYFAGQTVPRQLSAFNYRDFTTIDEEEKIGEYLKYRPRPFKAKDIVKDTLDYIGSQGVSLDSDTREALEKILSSKLTSGEIASGRDSDTRDGEDKASRSIGELEFENKSSVSKIIYRDRIEK